MALFTNLQLNIIIVYGILARQQNFIFNGTVGTKIQLEAICSKTYVVLYFLRVLSSLVMFTVFLFCPVIKGGLISLLLKIYYNIYVMAEHSL